MTPIPQPSISAQAAAAGARARNEADKVNAKILTLEELAGISAQAKAKGRRVVHCHGVFDLLHIGHIRYFGQAKRMGDLLLVTLTPDRFVDKGPHRPAFPEGLRAEAIASLDCVDYVAVNLWPTAEETLRLLRPDVYVKGSEYRNLSDDPTGKIVGEEAVVREIGAQMAFTDDIVFSSTNLINRYLSSMPEEVNNYLELFRSRHSLDEVLSLVERMSGLRVAVVGDTIIDEYQYCQTIGTSSKDPVLALKYQSHDRFAGGVLAVANHVASFAKEVHLLTRIGERDSQEDFIRGRLAPNVLPSLSVQPGAPTLVKRRFLDGYSANKIFEVYVMDDNPPTVEQEAAMNHWLRERLPEVDLVIAADFGHGMISSGMVDTLTQSPTFLAAMTQANAGNRGFHTISRYPRANFVSLSEGEVRLETRDLRGDARVLTHALGVRLGCRHFVTTRGRKGCLVYDQRGDLVEVPAFALRVLDRVGSGDAFLSLSSMASCLGADPEVLGLLGNVAGSLAVEILGNDKPVDKPGVQKYLTSLLK